MSNKKLPLLQLLLSAIIAPFNLKKASWKAFISPIVIMIISSFFLYGAAHFQLHNAVLVLLMIIIWCCQAWFALELQRQLLLGAQKAQQVHWKAYGLYIILLIGLVLILALLMSLLLRMGLPAIVWFAMAINSPQPWLASGIFLIWILIIGCAAYPVVRLVMVLPAIAIGEKITFMSIWQLSHHNGLRLMWLLVIIPGILAGFFHLILEPYLGNTLLLMVLTVIDIYLVLVYLSLLSLSFKFLTNLENVQASLTESVNWIDVIKTIATILVISSTVLVLNESFYRIEPGQEAVISGSNKTKRIETNSGVNVKLPFVEKANKVDKQKQYVINASSVFLTIDKKSLYLDYQANWKIIDSKRYTMAIGGQVHNANMRIEQYLHQELRNQLIKESPAMLHGLLDEGELTFNNNDAIKKVKHLHRIKPELNQKMKDFGIEVTHWKISKVKK